MWVGFASNRVDRESPVRGARSRQLSRVVSELQDASPGNVW
jgi:hypothetical protein